MGIFHYYYFNKVPCNSFFWCLFDVIIHTNYFMNLICGKWQKISTWRARNHQHPRWWPPSTKILEARKCFHWNDGMLLPCGAGMSNVKYAPSAEFKLWMLAYDVRRRIAATRNRRSVWSFGANAIIPFTTAAWNSGSNRTTAVLCVSKNGPYNVSANDIKIEICFLQNSFIHFW